MLREDLPGRFDYLFEPLDVAESAGDGDENALRALAQPDDDSRWSNWVVLAGVVLATIAAAAATAVALLQPAQPAQQTFTPTDATPASTSVSKAIPTAVPTAVPTATSIAVPTTAQPSAATPGVEPRQPPVQEPTTIASQPPGTTAPPPTTRAPISVSPESRTPFPNQSPPRNNDQRGGLLGGLL